MMMLLWGEIYSKSLNHGRKKATRNCFYLYWILKSTVISMVIVLLEIFCYLSIHNSSVLAFPEKKNNNINWDL